MSENVSLGPLRRDQVEIFAEGLYHLAASDGIDAREVAVIHEFLQEAGAPELQAQLGARPFDLQRACTVLDSSFVRRLFLKTAFVLLKADGVLSPAEQQGVTALAQSFGLQQDLAELETEVAGRRLD